MRLDLRGEVCPYTLLYAKLRLEDAELAFGDLLEILVDHPPAVRSLPQALREDGHAVLAVEPAADGPSVTIIVRKQPPPADDPL
jgi:TusA-related sulfurtransferase